MKADSLKELAQKMDVPPENLEATVARYNELCDLGKDLDYGKRPEVMGKVQDPPFYAGKLVASLLTMCGGLRTNTDCQVLRPSLPERRLFRVLSSGARSSTPPLALRKRNRKVFLHFFRLRGKSGLARGLLIRSFAAVRKRVREGR